MGPNNLHRMERVATHDAGAEEWHCPVCHRRLLLNWPPNSRRTVLAVGDVTAGHIGTRDSWLFGHNCTFHEPPELEPGAEQQPPAADNLAPWERYIDTLDSTT